MTDSTSAGSSKKVLTPDDMRGAAVCIGMNWAEQEVRQRCFDALQGGAFEIERLRTALEEAANELWRVPAASTRVLNLVRDALRPASETKPARDADHCDFPDCEQHYSYVLTQIRDHSTDPWAKGIARTAISESTALKANAGYPEATPPPGGWPKAACPHKHLEGKSLAAGVWVEVCDCGKIRYSEPERPHDWKRDEEGDFR